MISQIPIPYHVLFKWVDPLTGVLGMYGYFFQRDAVLSLWTPISQRNPSHDLLFYQVGSSLLGFAVINAVVLRRTNDLFVWKALQVAMFLVELGTLDGVFDLVARKHGVLTGGFLGGWMWLEFMLVRAVVRLSFLAGVGVGKKIGSNKMA
jgi:hypothetical protein